MYSTETYFLSFSKGSIGVPPTVYLPNLYYKNIFLGTQVMNNLIEMKKKI